MKTFLKIFSVIALAGILFYSCEDEEKIYQGDEFIHFDKESIVRVESTADTIIMPVYLAGELPSNDVTVSYSVETSAVNENQSVDESDYEIVEPQGQSITFRAGTAVAYVKMVVFDNVETDNAKMVTVSLGDAAGYVTGYPGSLEKRSFTLTITDDDCPLIAEHFTGQPEGTDLGGNSSVQFNLKEQVSDDIVTYEVSGIFMPQLDYFKEEYGEEILDSYPVVFTLDNSDPLNPTINIETSREDALIYYTDDGASTWQYYLYQSGTPATFSTCERSITAYYDIEVTENDAAPTGEPLWTEFKLDVQFTSKKSMKVKSVNISSTQIKSHK